MPYEQYQGIEIGFLALSMNLDWENPLRLLQCTNLIFSVLISLHLKEKHALIFHEMFPIHFNLIQNMNL